MPEELPLEGQSSDASILDGGTLDEGTESGSAEYDAGEGGEPEGDQQLQQEPVAAAQTVTEPARPGVQTPAVTSPYAQQGDQKPLFSAATRQAMETYLDASVIDAMEADMRTFANAEARNQAQMFVQSYEQQQEMAQELGIPAQYARDVKRYTDRIPDALKGTKQGAAVALMHGMFERANADPEQFDFNAEIAKYHQAVNPPAAPAAQPTRPASTVQPLPAAARTGSAQVSGRAVTAPVRTNGAKTNAVLAHFGAED